MRLRYQAETVRTGVGRSKLIAFLDDFEPGSVVGPLRRTHQLARVDRETAAVTVRGPVAVGTRGTLKLVKAPPPDAVHLH
ncbi:MAG: hypothetical protein M3423_09815 [Actinomycetota bacterium]|nr:hypothetical protein [Actinomycetota bacterium]